ncbi:RNA polymerase rpb1, domain 5 domain-containing protein [Ditylenchus destructor]|uniref:DNA-directed RNA polymerase subunit n=1 Tax=Ditylenchus destructor TaxID=166010 RepID=A0AAD4R545_9BILA|nr:RNA polymerase rpb1, domain 5 domain-containing protein [Ditylenchus destructor]
MGKEKEQFKEADYSRKVAGVKFTAGSTELIRQVSQVQVFNNKLYDETAGKWSPAYFGPLDTRLGTFQKNMLCETCGLNQVDCVGHFGFIDLEYPVFHVGFFRLVIQMMQCLCKNCSATLLTGEQKAKFLLQVQNPSLDYLRRKALHKRIIEASKKISLCTNCGFQNGVVKKAVGAVLKIVHGEPVKEDSLYEFDVVRREHKELNTLIPSSKFNLMDPLKVLNILRRVADSDIPLLMVGADENKQPIDLMMVRIPVPPVCIRPSVVSDLKAGTNEDDLTMKLTEIMLINDVLKRHKRDGAPMKTISETWDHLQVQCALYINSELSGLPPDMQPKKVLRSFTQRLKGKQGRFRGNLSGKRVDFSGRTVISPDPNLKIDQVGVPVLVAKILTFPEVVNHTNIEHMRKLVLTGDERHPGATYVHDGITGGIRSLRYGRKLRDFAAKSLQVGDIVERHMNDNDIVLFNRQPSLHKISIMAHRVKVMPYRTFRFNECACTPYNADFDGDEMNIHFPQTYEAKAEASLLMGLKSNLVTPRSGEPLVAAIQDFITSAYCFTHKDTFLTKSEFYRIAAALVDSNAKVQTRLRIPPPAIFKPVELWTGKQIVELIIEPNVNSTIKLNLLARNKNHKKTEDDFTSSDTFVRIRNNCLLSGMLDKSLLGSGSKNNIFYILLRDHSEDSAVEAMWRLARAGPVFLSNRGFSIGIGDVKPGEKLLNQKGILVSNGYMACEEFIEDLRNGKLKPRAGCSDVETLEALILGELSVIRDHAGKACVDFLPKRNSPLIMAVCGSKGSYINISQMIACVGQQSISNKRPPDGFENRSLPHFECNDRTPQAKGFVANSFYSGLTPTEFFFHTMAGREGLVDTAVKTAETGYMQRRLVKCLEDLAISYDNTVRTSAGEIVQFTFGEDGLDPAYMESSDGNMVNFEHILEQIRNTAEKGPLPKEFTELKLHIEDVADRMPQQVPSKFISSMTNFLMDYISPSKIIFDLPDHCSKHSEKLVDDCEYCKSAKLYKQALVQAKCLSASHITGFVNLCTSKIKRAIVEPGTAVGAIAATSIGEPSTQMTLKTFHFAGVASMNITQGVPRIKEIINAVKQISTPIITVTLANSSDEKLGRKVKARLEKTTLGEISDYIEQVYLPDDLFVLIKLNTKRIRLLQLEITIETILESICIAKLPVPVKRPQLNVIGKSIILIRPPETGKFSKSIAMHYITYHIGSVVVKGLPSVNRCVINADEKTGLSFTLLVEGTNFKEVLATPDINGRKTVFNNATIVSEVLGIEAARVSIINEILATMRNHSIDLDRRHVMLLADLMTYRGEVLGITRNGLVKMKESVLLLASFERTTDHLYEAAFFGQNDKIAGVSECIIMGTPMLIGTGMFKLLQNRGPLPSISVLQKEAVFESPSMNLQI